MRLLAAVAVLALALVAARADDLRPGYLEWREVGSGRWTVLWKAPLLGGLATRAEPVVPQVCAISAAQRRFEGAVMIRTFDIRCKATLAGRELGLAGLDRGFSDALLRVVPLERGETTVRLTAATPTAKVPSRPGRGEVVRTYLGLGVEHILLGFDHLLFVVALTLLIRGGRQLVATVTAFTIAHSLTLTAATLGLLAVARRPVEICIALSIVLVAREVLRSRDAPPTLARRWPAAIAFAFGLLHGFGFAAALAEIGLPPGEIPLALLAFNLGVEAGQLAIVAAALAALAALARWLPRWREPLPRFAAYGIGALSSAWLIERTLA